VAAFEVTPGETKIVPSNAINLASRVIAMCQAGGSAKLVQGIDDSRATFTCGGDQKTGQLVCSDKSMKIAFRGGGGVYCSRS
jgi:hypothetical protein